MAAEERAHGPATRVAIRNLARLKAEHQGLLRTLLDDAGMSSATLETLVEHLLEEEDASLQQDLVRVKAGSAAAAPASSASSARGGLSVGSLRPDASIATSPGGSVGSLRR